jgi:hypothetical protein
LGVGASGLETFSSFLEKNGVQIVVQNPFYVTLSLDINFFFFEESLWILIVLCSYALGTGPLAKAEGLWYCSSY